MRVLRAALLPLLIVVLSYATPALAVSKVGQKAGEELASWGKGVLLAVAGLVAIPLLAKRDTGGAVVVALICVLVGGFLFAPQVVTGVIEGFWRAIDS